MSKSKNVLTGAALALAIGGGAAGNAAAKAAPSSARSHAANKHESLDQKAGNEVSGLAVAISDLLQSQSPYVSYTHYNDRKNVGQYTVQVWGVGMAGKLPGAYNLSFTAPNGKDGRPDAKRAEAVSLSEGGAEFPGEVSSPYTSLVFSKDSRNGSWLFESVYQSDGLNPNLTELAASTEPDTAAHEGFLSPKHLNAAISQGRLMIRHAQERRPVSEMNPAFVPIPGSVTVPVK